MKRSWFNRLLDRIAIKLSGLPKYYSEPELTFPKSEEARIRQEYEDAEQIAEYGSGGSTVFFAEIARLSRKRLISVESDRKWAMYLRRYLRFRYPTSNISVLHADIGPTKKWGRPKSDIGKKAYPDYARAIWANSPDFSPDLVLIDGRFRVACFVECLKNIKRPTRILFDDYAPRHTYHVVEDVLKPSELVNRMAVFDADPSLIDVGKLDQFDAFYYDPD